MAIVAHRKDAVANLAAAMAVLTMSAGAAQIERFQFPENHIAEYTSDAERFAQVELYLPQTPREIIGSDPFARAMPPHQTGRGWVRAIHTSAGWSAASGEILLTIEEFHPGLAAGQTVRVTGVLQRPNEPMNPGEFDFAGWGRDQRVLATLHAAHADGVQIIGRGSEGPFAWLRERAVHMLDAGFTFGQAADQALLRDFVLGDPDPRLADLEDQFLRTGVIHFLAVSGLHIAIIGAIAAMIARLLRFSPRTALTAALTVICLYAIVAAPTWAGWRSILMATAACVALVNRRSTDVISGLYVAVAAILLIHPADLHGGGFQISCAAVAGMIFLADRTGIFLMNQMGDPLTPPDQVRPRGRRRGLAAAIWRFCRSVFIAGLVAWILSMPLIAYHYGQLSLLAIPAGLILLPVTFVALPLGVGKVVLTSCWPSAAHFFATICLWPLQLLRYSVQGLYRIPGSAIGIASPPIWLVVIFYICAALIVIQFRRTQIRWLIRFTFIAIFLLVFGWSLVPHPLFASSGSARSFRITLISVGAGQCAVLRGPSNHAVLIDVGSSTVPEVHRALLEPYLRAVGCGKIDEVLLSHGDYDHISAGADIFMDDGEPPFFTSPHFARHAIGNEPAEALLDLLDSAHHMPRQISQGDHLDLEDGATLDVLWPPKICDMNSNNCGLVLKFQYGGRSVLFPADIQQPPEIALVKNPEQLRCDVLVAPHHGSAETTTADFIAAVHPDWILASSGGRLTHKQKTFDALAATTHAPFYRTSRFGAITVEIDHDGKLSLTTFRSSPLP